MFEPRVISLMTALAMAVAVTPAAAQDAETGDARQEADAPPSVAAPATRQSRDRRERREQRRQAEPTPEQNLAAATALAGQTGIACQPAEAAPLGVTAAQELAFEVRCASGPGFILVSSTPPKAISCLELAGQATMAREEDPEADAGQQCTLPANQDVLGAVSVYAREAAVACTIDRASAIGKSSAGELIFEVGCSDQGGWLLQKSAAGWTKSPCWNAALEGAQCRFTTPDEIKASWRAVLTGTPASACNVENSRIVGRDAQGLTVYELKCGADEGYFVRVNTETWAAQRVNSCEESALVAGGCTLTTVAAAPASEGGRA